MSATDYTPHSTEAEQATLGAMIADQDTVIELLAKLRADDYYDPTHREIFAGIAELSNARSPIDVLTLSDRLKGNTLVEAAGGGAYIAELCASVPSFANAAEYGEIVRNKAVQRAVAAAGFAISKAASSEQLTGNEALEQAERAILAISRQSSGSKPQHVGEIGTEAYERYVRLRESGGETTNVKTGFRDLDRMIDLEPEALVIIAARPSLGKTSLALTIASQAAASQGKNVAIFSFEMSKQSLMDRIVAGLLGVETWKLKKGKLTDDEFRELGKQFDGLKKHPLFIDDDPDVTIANLRSKARRQQLEHGLDLLIVDYLQLMEAPSRMSGENRTQQVSYISRQLKNLARELECPIIALSQLSRSVEQRSPAIPILSDLRESGSIEQDADVVLMLYREDAYNEDCDNPGVTDVYVRKNRNGATGRVNLFFDAKRMTFCTLERRDLQARPHTKQSLPDLAAA